MTVLEWLKASTRYTFEEQTFIKIALDRECDPDADVYGDDVTKRQRELMTADIIFTAVLLSPSNTASLSQSHNGYQKTIRIYNTYGDERGDTLDQLANTKKIKFVPIVDVDRI